MAIREVESATGKVATEELIARQLGITRDEYADWQSQMAVTNVISLNEFMEQGVETPLREIGRNRVTCPEESLEREEIKQKLAEALDLLTDKERKVILLYYYEELTLREVSEVLEVSESRVSQLHVRALQKMNQKLGSYFGILTEL